MSDDSEVEVRNAGWPRLCCITCLAAWVCLGSALAGCSIVKDVRPDFEHVSKVAAPGDTARIVKRDGTPLTLRVSRIEADALIGTSGKRDTFAEHSVQFADIQDLKIIGRGLRRFTKPEKVGVGTVISLALLWLLIAFIHG